MPPETRIFRHAYVHVPFCSRRCTYCDFSIAVRREVPVDEFVRGVISELAGRRAAAVSGGLETLYFGGGTPSKLGPSGVGRLITELAENGLPVAKTSGEVTIEANPEDLVGSAPDAWLKAGVNRLSIGVQSFQPAALEWMHRTHTATEAAAAVKAARSAGFGDISIDLIYALPDRLGRNWTHDLDMAIGLEPDHLSVYGLTVEPRTPLGKWTARGEETPETDDQAADQFLEAHERLTAAGFEHYEVSSYARPGRRSRHNSAYWQRVPYLGFGPSAHSFDGTTRRWNTSAYAEWVREVMVGTDPLGGEERLTPAQSAAESLYLGLRSDAGADIDNPSVASAWAREGWATREGPRVRLTPEGWLRLDALVASVVA